MRGTKTVIERMESADRINDLDRLLKEREDLLASFTAAGDKLIQAEKERADLTAALRECETALESGQVVIFEGCPSQLCNPDLAEKALTHARKLLYGGGSET